MYEMKSLCVNLVGFSRETDKNDRVHFYSYLILNTVHSIRDFSIRDNRVRDKTKIPIHKAPRCSKEQRKVNSREC